MEWINDKKCLSLFIQRNPGTNFSHHDMENVISLKIASDNINTGI